MQVYVPLDVHERLRVKAESEGDRGVAGLVRRLAFVAVAEEALPREDAADATASPEEAVEPASAQAGQA